jgi:hypothetical protein
LLPLAYSVWLIFCFNLSLAVDPAILFFPFFSSCYFCYSGLFLNAVPTQYRHKAGRREQKIIKKRGYFQCVPESVFCQTDRRQ